VQEYGEGLRLQILEFRFAAEVRMREDYDKAKDIKFFPAIGDDPTTEEELELVAMRRDARRRAREMEVLSLLALTGTKVQSLTRAREMLVLSLLALLAQKHIF
jgi:hypothetical protein